MPVYKHPTLGDVTFHHSGADHHASYTNPPGYGKPPGKRGQPQGSGLSSAAYIRSVGGQMPGTARRGAGEFGGTRRAIPRG